MFSVQMLSRRAVSVVTVAAVVVVGGAVAFAPVPASAAPLEGSEWGSQGSIASNSAVSVRWDNAGNVGESIVPRDASQKLLHTDGKSYADIEPAWNAAYGDRFGPGNGQGGLRMSVSQSKDLVNQNVQVNFSGGPKWVNVATTRLQLFQCWGAMGADGKPDPAATSPDPATCQVGAGGVGSTSTPDDTRAVFLDPLIKGGDWGTPIPDPHQEGVELIPTAPFTAIDGTKTVAFADRVIEARNPFFNPSTTNEAQVSLDEGGSAQADFEIQTGAEASGLGCGLAAGQPSTPTCWLVAVPRDSSIASVQGDLRSSTGSVSPSVWAQRMQVKLDFQPVGGYCSGADSRSLAGGSELLSSAMASWIPAMCTVRKLSTGFSVLADPLARRQQGAGALPVAFTTEASPGAAHAPVALTGVAIAFNIDILDRDTSSGAYNYVSRALPELNINARLLAKLLTQTYQDDIVMGELTYFLPDVPWYEGLTKNLFADPEFQRLNPSLTASEYDISRLRVGLEALQSDAAARVWAWLINDEAAAAFLGGCPDPSGITINPFYSTRSYAACSGEQVALEAAAKEKRDSTVKPGSYVDQAMAYPSDAAPFPQIGWYQYRTPKMGPHGGVKGPDDKYVLDPDVDPMSFTDRFPRADSMAAAGRESGRAKYSLGKEWSSKASGEVPPDYPRPGKWVDPVKAPMAPGSRQVMTVTDTATAAKYQSRTAKLCNTEGTECVGANTASLLKEAARFGPVDANGVQAPASTPDYEGGAYPLAMPVYAAVRTEGAGGKAAMAPADAKSYAQMLDYVSTAGQAPGFASGQLPAGYAPLPEPMRAQTAALVSKLNALTGPGLPAPITGANAPGSPAESETPAGGDATAAGEFPDFSGTETAQEATASGGALAMLENEAASATKPAGIIAKAAPQRQHAGGVTDTTAGLFGRYTLVIGLGIGLLAALASPLLGRIGRGKQGKA